METLHEFVTGRAADTRLPAESVSLVVTSPPYPMISMWDDQFADANPQIGEALASGDGMGAWNRMHAELDLAWTECERVLHPGGFLCVNIGDATRTIDETFRLYANHARVTSACIDLGLNPLPMIHWYKPTNAPNKFMGSGMLPAGAYVTLEHEYILLFRKGGKRVFPGGAREHRRRSAYFWEERNRWFSDRWTIGSVRQGMLSQEVRARTAAFPFELPFRLISMYSAIGDTVLDPFSGTGTTARAAAAAGRNSVSVDTEASLHDLAREDLLGFALAAGAVQTERMEAHREFVEARTAGGKPLRHFNEHLELPVMTRQEAELALPVAEHAEAGADGRVRYTYVSPVGQEDDH